MDSLTAADFIAKKNAEFSKSHIVGVKDIGREGRHFFYREAWTFMPQSDLPDKKVFVIERLRKESIEGSLAYQNWKKGEIEYRIGYFIIGRIGRTAGKWIWGQFCPLLPSKDLRDLLIQAKKDKVLLY